ncbi:MAG: MFS transporter, partial [Promethearchaeota archaeon]
AVIMVVLLLLLINNASLNMLIPSYGVIIKDFQIRDEIIYFPDSLSVLISAFMMIIWGYYTDKLDRNKVINIGAFLSCVGFIFTAFCVNYFQLIIARILTGVGMGFAIPVGFSILSDIVPTEERSMMFGLLAIYSSVANGIGQGLSAFIGPLNIFEFGWHFPFFVLSLLAIISVIMLRFVKLPEIGSTEESLADLHEFEEVNYGYKINQRELGKILRKSTNKHLITNGFFSIIPGTIIIFSLILTFSHENTGLFSCLPPEIRIQVSTLMAGIASFGYIIGSIVLAQVGDAVFKKNPRNRARLALICNILAIPLTILMVVEMKRISLDLMPSYPDIIPPDQITSYMIETMIAIFTEYPSYGAYVLFSFLGTFFSAGMVTNKNAVMVDVNLPEHRGTATSFFQLTEQIGKSITLFMAAGILAWLGSYKNILYFGMLFWIPSAFFWFLSVKTVVKDIREKDVILRERTQVTFIDYFFELEIAIDEGIQRIQDAKDYLLRDPERSEEFIVKALNKFIWITAKAHKKEIMELETRGIQLTERAMEFQDKLNEILVSKDSKAIKELYNEIDNKWEESDFGKLEILYQGAYLKVCEARLKRFISPIECSHILQNAIDTYDRVIRLATDRVVEEGTKVLNKDEKEIQERIMNMVVNAKRSKSNTELLKSKFDKIVIALLAENIKEDEFEALTNLAQEYGVQMFEVMEESLDRTTIRKIKRSMRETNKLFKAYDQWENSE